MGQTNKHFRIVKETQIDGEVNYVVNGASNWFEATIGMWSEYTKEHKTFDAAINHIKDLISWSVVKRVTVYKTKIKNGTD